MSSISPLTTANILPPTIPPIGPSLSSESEDEGDKPEKNTRIGSMENLSVQITGQSAAGISGM